MTGFTSKRQMAQDRLAEMLDLCDYLEGNDASLEAQCKAAAFIREALAQPVQEPVDNDFFKSLGEKNPSPDKREWVGLTEEKIQAIHDTYYRRMGPQEFARAIEAALKEKNFD
jgi:hypothetical protein